MVLATGVWLVLLEGNGDFSQLWVILALAAFALAFVIGAGFLGRSAIRLERVATGAAVDLGAAREALGSWIAGYLVVLAILVFALWDMVFRPAWPRGDRPGSGRGC